ncbi:MAG: serine/threonine protein kinase, partial [Parascardovia denticolens]
IERRLLDEEAHEATGEFTQLTNGLIPRTTKSDFVIPRYLMLRDGTIVDQYENTVVDRAQLEPGSAPANGLRKDTEDADRLTEREGAQ